MEEDRPKDANGTGSENDEEETNSKGDVVVPGGSITAVLLFNF